MPIPIDPKRDHEASLLAKAQTYCQDQIVPQGAVIDQETKALKQAIHLMGEQGLLGLRVSQEWGGADLSPINYARFQMMIARYSGTLAFLQTQHQTAGAKLSSSENHPLKQTYLPDMVTGNKLVGVGFSQLRRQGEPLMQAIAVEGGYRLTGEVPWITGWDIFEAFIIGAMLPTGEAVYGMVALTETEGIHYSQPMKLAAMGSSNTVRAIFKDWFLSSDRLVSIALPGDIQIQDQQTVLNHGFFALGCAQAGLDIVEKIYQRKQLPFLLSSLNTLRDEVSRCTQGMLAGLSPKTIPFEERLYLRGWAINLAGRCSQAAVIASSGGANFLDHPAQRVYREALVFMVIGQTTAVMEESLGQLLDRQI